MTLIRTNKKNHIFAATNLTIGRLTSEFPAGIFFARKYAAYNPVPTLNGLESPMVGLVNGKCTPFFICTHDLNTIKMKKSLTAPGSATPEHVRTFEPGTISLNPPLLSQMGKYLRDLIAQTQKGGKYE